MTKSLRNIGNDLVVEIKGQGHENHQIRNPMLRLWDARTGLCGAVLLGAHRFGVQQAGAGQLGQAMLRARRMFDLDMSPARHQYHSG